jgi:Exonuclease III
MALQAEDALRITSANLNGIRSAASKGFFDWMGQHRPDVVCVQELKGPACRSHARDARAPRVSRFFHCAEKRATAGWEFTAARSPTV